MRTMISGLGEAMLPGSAGSSALCPGCLSPSRDSKCTFLFTQKFYIRTAADEIYKLNKVDLCNAKTFFIIISIFTCVYVCTVSAASRSALCLQRIAVSLGVFPFHPPYPTHGPFPVSGPFFTLTISWPASCPSVLKPPLKYTKCRSLLRRTEGRKKGHWLTPSTSRNGVMDKVGRDYRWLMFCSPLRGFCYLRDNLLILPATVPVPGSGGSQGSNNRIAR